MRIENFGGAWLGVGSAGPRSFFLNSEPGFLLDFTKTSPLYQDTIAATPLTLPDQSVGLAADRSRARSPITVAAAVQASSGLRPKWGRMPKTGRRNLLTFSEQFDDAAWAKFDLTVTPNNAVAPDGTLTADTLVGNTANSVKTIRQISLPSTVGTFTVYAKAAGETVISLWLVGASVGANFTLTGAGSTALQGATSSSITAVGNGWYRCQVYHSSATTTANIYLRTGDVFVGDGVSGVHIWGAQLETGSTATACQAVTNAFDATEAGLPSYGYIRPDLMDDYLTVTTPAAQTGDVMVFGRKGSWLETGVAYGSGAAVAIGPTTMTGLPAGLLQAVQGPVSDISGGLVGVLAIGRTLTAAERTAALNYYKARGAAGLLTAGAERVTNWDFATAGFVGFSNASTGTGSASISGGQAILTGADVSNRGKIDGNTLTGVTIGSAWIIEWVVLSGTVNSQVTVSSGSTVFDKFGATTVGTNRGVFIAAATTINFSANVYGAGTVVFDSISIKPLTVTP